MARSSSGKAPARGRTTPRKGRTIAQISIAAGDPLQPAGLTEYLSDARKARPAAAPATPPKAEAPSRAHALKAAHARWTSKQKNGKSS